MITLNPIAYFKRKRAEKILSTLAEQLNDPKTEVSRRVETKATLLASIYVMRWYDQKRIRHCAICPSTDTLRNLGGQFYCPHHGQAVPVHG